MPRTIHLSVPVESREALAAELDQLDLLGLRLHPGASLRPPGDVVVLEVANEGLGRVMRVAGKYGLGQPGGLAMSTNEPLSVISTTAQTRIREATTTCTAR